VLLFFNTIHSVDAFVSQQSTGTECIAGVYVAVALTAAGDFNTLCTDFLVKNHGFC
jgi:hypothetical protein